MSYKEEKAIVSYYYDKNWNAFKSFLRKRFALSDSSLRRLYVASFSELVEKVHQQSFNLEKVPFKIQLFRLGSQRAVELLAVQSKEIPKETPAYLEEYAWQEQYIQIHRCVYCAIHGKDSIIRELEPTEMLVCIRQLLSIQGIKEKQCWNRPMEEVLSTQDKICAYYNGSVNASQRHELEKRVKEDQEFAQQYDATMLYLETEENILNELELIHVIKDAPKELFPLLLKEKKMNKRFIWQAAIVALILFLLNCLIKLIW